MWITFIKAYLIAISICTFGSFSTNIYSQQVNQNKPTNQSQTQAQSTKPTQANQQAIMERRAAAARAAAERARTQE